MFMPSRKISIIVIFVPLLLSACASSHNLQSGNNLLGGGYLINKVNERTYRITSRTNFAPWVNERGARNSWIDRADEVCGEGRYKAIDTSFSHFNTIPSGGLPYIVTEMTGYAVCGSKDLSEEEAWDIALGRKS